MKDAMDDFIPSFDEYAKWIEEELRKAKPNPKDSLYTPTGKAVVNETGPEVIINPKYEAWGFRPPPNESLKVSKIKQILVNTAEDAIILKEKIWFHYYRPNVTDQDRASYNTGFGFSVVDGFIFDCNEPGWEGQAVSPEKLEKLKSEGRIAELPLKQIIL